MTINKTLWCLLLFLFVQQAMAKDYPITSFGAKPGTNNLNTLAINKAIDACNKNGGGRVIIPAGLFRSGTIFMKDNVELYLEIGATLLASADLKDLPMQPKAAYRSQKDTVGWRALIFANEVSNIAITGLGTIDGNGAQQKPDPNALKGDLDGRPRNILFISCKKIRVEGIKMLNAGIWNQHYLNCEDVIVDRINVYNHANRNNDGIDIDGCRRFTLSNSTFDTDDDAIVLKSTGPAGCENIVITNCIVSSFCNAIKAGTESTGGFRNIAISNCVVKPSSNPHPPIYGTAKGIAALSLEIVDGGIMDGVSISNITIEGSDCPLFVRLGNRARKHFAGAPEPPVGIMRNIVINNVVAYHTGNYSSSITGIPGNYVENLSLSNVQFYNTGGLKQGDYISDVTKVKEDEKGYPQPTVWKELPSSGIFIRHAKNIQVRGLMLGSEQPDPRVPVIAVDVDGLQVQSIGKVNNSTAGVFFKGWNVNDVLIDTPLAWKKEVMQFDIAVYGGTSAGVIAAYSAKKLGKSVLLIEPGKHLGGLTSGGLGYTDIGNKYAIGGLSLDFYRRIGKHYGSFEQWIFEPSVAEKTFLSYIQSANVPVIYDYRLKQVKKQNGSISEITIGNKDDDKVVKAKMFIDCSYEGDLMARAGVSYMVGREGNAVYGETYNGVQMMEGHQFPDGIDPYKIPGNASSGLLWGISDAALAQQGLGDKKVQAYNFRICLTNVASNRIAITRPEDYDSSRYELLLRYIQKTDAKDLKSFLKIDLMPNGKTDINNKGPFSTDMIGMNYDYAEASYESRKQLIKAHENYTKGLLYFIGHNSRMPLQLREQMLQWGYPKDEYTDNNNWTHQLYIREARRMIGAYVMTQANCEGKERVQDGIAMAAYTMDSHNCQRIVIKKGDSVMVKNEGNVEIGGFGPYPVAYRAIIPKESECKNLLVPVCLSASHIAYGSIRMEPVFMALAQSAAIAASLAIDKQLPVQSVDAAAIQKILQEDPLLDGSEPDIVVDDADTKNLIVTGTWEKQKRRSYGPSMLVSNEKGATVRFMPAIKDPGSYSVYTYLPKVDNMAIIIYDGKQQHLKTIRADDIKVKGQTSGEWIFLGEYEFQSKPYIEISNKEGKGPVVADAVLLKRVNNYPTSWNDPALQKQIESNIEKYRKDDAVITVVDEKGKPVANATVVVHQQTSEFKFGCNLFVLHQLATPEMNKKYEAAFTKLFNFATIPFYWAELEPKQDSLRFAKGSAPMWRRIPPDEAVEWCKEHNIMIKGHPLLYIKNRFMPSWISRTDPATLQLFAKKRMAQLASRYGNAIDVWDVVNEDVARIKNPNAWLQAPDDYLAWAFKTADSLFPAKAILMINDETKTSHDSTAQYVSSIQGLLQRNIRVDGIGIQFHMLLVDKFLKGEVFTPAIMHNAYSTLGKFNKPLWITEITVPSNKENGWENQAVIVSNIYKLWFSEPQMKGVTWWNLGDGTAFGTENNFKGGLLDSAMNPKPAYKVLDQLINHEWRTNLTLKTDANGKASFRGFHGGYLIEVKKGKIKKQVSLELKSENSSAKAKLVLSDEVQ